MRKVVDMRNDTANEVMSKATLLLPICNYLVDIIKQEDIEPTCKQKQDEIGLSQKEIWQKKYNGSC